jgi:2-dehydro-3-deoxyglucarate aldolase
MNKLKDNKLKQKLKLRKVTFGSWITTGNTNIAEIMAQSGFEWLTVDMEHSAITLDIAQQLIQVIESYDVAPLVRIGEKNPNLIKRVMDAGAYGVIVPMVNSKKDAELAVNAVKYPPIGTRGVGLARAQKYGFDFEEYASALNNSIVIAQIEHIDGVNNLEDILSVKGIDGCIVGPYDLSGSLGIPGKFNDTKVKSALEKVEKICKKMNVSLGMHVISPDYKEVKKYAEKGYTFLAISLDTLFLGTICREQLKKAKKEIK